MPITPVIFLITEKVILHMEHNNYASDKNSFKKFQQYLCKLGLHTLIKTVIIMSYIQLEYPQDCKYLVCTHVYSLNE